MNQKKKKSDRSAQYVAVNRANCNSIYSKIVTRRKRKNIRKSWYGRFIY